VGEGSLQPARKYHCPNHRIAMAHRGMSAYIGSDGLRLAAGEHFPRGLNDP